MPLRARPGSVLMRQVTGAPPTPHRLGRSWAETHSAPRGLVPSPLPGGQGTLTGEGRCGRGAIEEAGGRGHTEAGHARRPVAAEASSEAAAVATLLRARAGREPAGGRTAAAARVACERAAVRGARRQGRGSPSCAGGWEGEGGGTHPAPALAWRPRRQWPAGC